MGSACYTGARLHKQSDPPGWKASQLDDIGRCYERVFAAGEQLQRLRQLLPVRVSQGRLEGTCAAVQAQPVAAIGPVVAWKHL